MPIDLTFVVAQKTKKQTQTKPQSVSVHRCDAFGLSRHRTGNFKETCNTNKIVFEHCVKIQFKKI